MQAKDFDYHLPPELIAQKAKKRGYSRLLVVHRRNSQLEDRGFRNIADYMEPGDCLVINDTRVMAARLFAVKESTQARIEILLHQELEPGVWSALARPCRRLKPGTVLQIGTEKIKVRQMGEQGKIELEFRSPLQAKKLMANNGNIPLPPYIKRTLTTSPLLADYDTYRYQTLFARYSGSVAAPTAGLHFSRSLIDRLDRFGIHLVPVTLHVGWGTFSSLPDGPLMNTKLHEEYFNISRHSADLINECKRQGKKVIACGTTVTRTLESNVDQNGVLQSGQGKTDLFIKPGYHWKMVDHLITNFHLPKSSLFMLISAFAGKELIDKAYQHAISQAYRFYSYGDAMMVL